MLRLLCGPHRFTASSECETSLIGYLDPKTEHVQQRKYDNANFTARLVLYVTWSQVWDPPLPLEQYWYRRVSSYCASTLAVRKDDSSIGRLRG